jgi:beta-N-acetylhexosaminidase
MVRPPLAAILSVAGHALTDAERALFSACHPVGFILFARNCGDPVQLRALTDELRDVTGWNCPVLIDQEGGRVARMKPPAWPEWPSARKMGEIFEQDEAAGRAVLHTTTRDMAEHLTAAGINVNCVPVLDVASPAMTDAIGTRCYSAKPDVVASAGMTACETLLSHGVTPVIKHLPGHGRATVDSHMVLPHLDATLADLQRCDFAPFKAVLASPFGPKIWGMVAHLLIPALDADLPSSLSKAIIQDIIRDALGLTGPLVTDDLDMKALAEYGNPVDRALKSLESGCDIALYCHADLEVMQDMAQRCPALTDIACDRLAKSGFKVPS